jgi:hypothetical protein
MPLIKLRKANEDGEEVGVLVVNTDQIVAMSEGKAVTEIQTADGKPRWVKNSVDEIIKLAGK